MKKQLGSAHVIIAIAVILVLIGVLGLIFWQNLKDKNRVGVKTETTKTEETKAKEPKMLTANIGEPFELNMSFQYPDTWKLKQTVEGPNPATDESSTSQKITLTPPTGPYSVNLSLVSGGLGGTCGDSETGKIQSFSYENLEQFKNATLIEDVYTNLDGKFFADARLYERSDYFQPTEIKAGDTSCKLYLGFLNFKTNKVTAINFVETNIIDSDSPKVGYSTFKEAKEAFSGKYYDEAKSILLSLSLK